MRAQDFDLLLLAVDDIAQLAQRIILISEFYLDLLKTLVAHVGSLPGWCCSALVEFFSSSTMGQQDSAARPDRP